MSSSLSSLSDHLFKGLHKGKCKDCKSDLEYITVSVATKENTLTFKCIDCDKNYEKKFDKDLANRSQNTHKFCE